MAIPFASPEPRHYFQFQTEADALDAHFDTRAVPQKTDDRLLLCSWNIANLGAQDRTPTGLRIIAHILSRFELIAVQEVNEEFRIFAKVVALMDGDYEYVMTDTAGNDERLAFIYDRSKVKPLHLFGELALRDWEFPKRDVDVRYRQGGEDKVQTFKKLKFRPFDRNPFIGSFGAGSIAFTLVNCHLYFGKFGNSTVLANREKYARRVMEIHALAKWADRRGKRRATYDRDIILTGDMNVPAMTPLDSAYDALVEFGMQPLDHPTKAGGTNLGNDKTYDQMAFAPGSIDRRIKDYGVFDFDNAVFAPLWQRLHAELSPKKAVSGFVAHVRHHISDHRPLWAALDISPA